MNVHHSFASDKVVELVNKIHHLLYVFLDQYGHESNIESHFKNIYSDILKIEFCPVHNCDIQVIDKIIRLDIYLYNIH